MQYKKVLMGVAAATIGAAAFGAVHFMFLAPQFGVGDFFGIPFSVVVPFLLGAVGFLLGLGFVKKEGVVKDIVLYGSAAVIGFGVAEYAQWITPVAAARARASASIPRYVPPPVISAPNGPVGSPGFSGVGGSMMI